MTVRAVPVFGPRPKSIFTMDLLEQYAINVVQACWRGQWQQSILTKAEQTCLFLITTIMSDGQDRRRAPILSRLLRKSEVVLTPFRETRAKGEFIFEESRERSDVKVTVP